MISLPMISSSPISTYHLSLHLTLQHAHPVMPLPSKLNFLCLYYTIQFYNITEISSVILQNLTSTQMDMLAKSIDKIDYQLSLKIPSLSASYSSLKTHILRKNNKSNYIV